MNATPKQNPRKWSFNQEGEIVVAKNPYPPVLKPVELPIELRQAIESPLANVREGAVRELDHLLNGSNANLVLVAHETLKHLMGDDSRRVSNAASESLKAYEARSKAEADRKEQERLTREAERAAKERLAHLAAQAEQDRIAKAKLEEERLAAEKAERERLAQQQAEAARIAQEKLAVERLAREKAEEEKQARLSALYNSAIQAARLENWQSAIESFRQVLVIDYHYRDTAKLLSKAEAEQKKIQQVQARAARLDRLYQQVQKWHKTEDWPRMIAACDELLSLDAHYRDVPVLRERAQTNQQRLEAEQQRTAQLADWYAQAQQLKKARNWAKLILVCQDILAMDARYKDVADLLSQARDAEQAEYELAIERARQERLAKERADTLQQPVTVAQRPSPSAKSSNNASRSTIAMTAIGASIVIFVIFGDRPSVMWPIMLWVNGFALLIRHVGKYAPRVLFISGVLVVLMNSDILPGSGFFYFALILSLSGIVIDILRSRR